MTQQLSLLTHPPTASPPIAPAVPQQAAAAIADAECSAKTPAPVLEASSGLYAVGTRGTVNGYPTSFTVAQSGRCLLLWNTDQTLAVDAADFYPFQNQAHGQSLEAVARRRLRGMVSALGAAQVQALLEEVVS